MTYHACMKADEIRESRTELNNNFSTGGIPQDTVEMSQIKMLGEIAAQLAELNEQLRSLIDRTRASRSFLRTG